MEKESTSTWAYLDKSGEIVNVEAELGNSSESSIEFIHDEAVHYERNNHRSSLQPEMLQDSQDVVENPPEVLGADGAVLEDTAASNEASAINEGGNGENIRSEFTLENISSVHNNASISPNSNSPISPISPVSPVSPVSPSSSSDSSGSVTLLEGRFSDGDLDTFPEDFWFDSDFELLDQYSSSDLAHLQLAAGVGNTLPAAQRPKFNFKFKKQAVGTSETESVNASDADDEGSNNVEQCSSPEESEVAPPAAAAAAAPVDDIPPVTSLGSLAPIPQHLPVPAFVLRPPRMSSTFWISLLLGILLGFATKYSLGPYSSEQLSEDIDEMQRLNDILLLREENEHMRKYVDSLKWRMGNLQNSNKQQLLDELQHVNQLLKGRLDELRQQLDQMAGRRDNPNSKNTVKPPTVSDTKNQDLNDVVQNMNEPAEEDNPELMTDVPQDSNEPASKNDPGDTFQDSNERTLENDSESITSHFQDSDELALESDPESHTEIGSSIEAVSHDDIIQIHSSSEELPPGVDLSVNPDEDNGDEISDSGVSLVNIHQNDGLISSDEIIEPENEADDSILQRKLEEEKTRADHLEKLYKDLKRLVDSREPTTDSSTMLVDPSTEEIPKKKAKESASYCSPLDKDCTVSMDWLNQDAMLHLVKSVISEIPPQAQQWKEFMSKKFQSILDPEGHQKPDEGSTVDPEIDSNFQFEKLNAYMNNMLNQMNRAKDDLQNKFEKTMLKIKKGTSKFWEKTATKNEKETKSKKSKGNKNKQELMNIEDDEAEHRSFQESRLDLTEEDSHIDSVDKDKKYEMSQQTESLGGLEVVDVEQTKHKFDKKVKSFKTNGIKRQQHHKSDDGKKHRSHKSNQKGKEEQLSKSKKEEKKHRRKFDDEEPSSKESGHSEKKYKSFKSNNDKKVQHRSKDNKKHKLSKSDIKEKEHQSESDESDDDDDDYKKKLRSKYDDDEDKKKLRSKYDDYEDKKKLQRPKYDDDRKHNSHKSNIDKKHNSNKLDKKYKKHHIQESDDNMNKQKYKSPKNKKHNTRESDDYKTNKQLYKSPKNKKHVLDNEKKHSKKHKSLNKKIIDKRLFNAKSASKRMKIQIGKGYDDEKMVEFQKHIHKKMNKKFKNNPEMKAQTKESCDQLAVKLEDSISTISKEKFRRMKLHTITRLSKKLSGFNKQCKPFSSRSVKEWSACQQMWWTLCGRGFLPGQLRNSKCQHYLLPWQMKAASSPDGGGKPGCDDCGCLNKALKEEDSLDLSEEDQQGATDSDSASRNINDKNKVKSGEWYFRHKSAPSRNKARECGDDEYDCMSEDFWDDEENDKLQHLDQMMYAEFYRFNHHNRAHRKRCRDHSRHNIYCYKWFQPMHKGMKWVSVYYENMLNFLQNWQKQHI